MKRTEIINLLIQSTKTKKYLEIGVSDSANFSNIKCDYKVGIDPEPTSPATFHLTSDEFFEKNRQTFDVIFIDGLHHADQVYKDVINSLEVLNEGGYIVCHDLNPVEEQHQIIPYQGGAWNGDCWKAFVMLRMERDDLEMYTVDADCGCGIITRGSQELLNLNYPMTYHYLDKNRKELLNLISPEEFLSKFIGREQHNISQLLHNYIYDPENPEYNFALALYYHKIGQTASAVSYYLRTAERAEDDLLKYECLICGAMCFESQGTRNFTVKGLLLHALSLCPKRPEAYYLMSKFHENENKDGSWNECYTIASIGLEVSNLNPEPLRTSVDYPGEYALLFQKALSSWWCGLCKESRDLFLDLLDNYEMTEEFRQVAINNLKKMNVEIKPFATYTKDKFDRLKVKFDGAENILENYSEAYQDMFVLTILNGKRNGTYLEIGAGNAFYGNNTALLEKDFDWKGIAFDICEEFVNAHNNERKNTCLLKNALTTNYELLLEGMDFPKNIDYLQLDCDPPEVTYKILLNMPFETHKFAVITYEHDYYCDETKSFQEKSRKYLESYGYVRVVNNISPDTNRPYEDWWVHPELVDHNIISQMMNISDETKKAENYILLNSSKKEEPTFDWGEISENQWFLEVVNDEIFVQDVYQKFFRVEQNDVVVDIGASAGPFTYNILKNNPQKVYCLEPHKNLFKTLTKNLDLNSDKVVLINKGIADTDGEIIFKGLYNKDSSEMWSKEVTADAMTFKTLIESYNIQKINFLKTDCEGGEYDIFNQENFEWIKQNVEKIAGEWHLSNEYLKNKFKEFRDLYLKEMPNHQIYSMDGVDIKWSLWEDWFINYYGTITVWVDNRSDETLDSFDWGLFEKNDLLSKCIKKEFDGEANYEKFFSVKKDDIVLDIGASVGPFTKSILDKNPKLVLSLEPHPRLFETLNNNFSEFDNVKCINKGISSKDGEVIFENLFDDTKGYDYVGDDLWKKREKGIGITFKSLIKENNIEKIDFLKIDCEGGEYDVFTLDNFYWIKNNVKKIAGEWHLGDANLKQKFLDFRDFYLRKFDNFKVFFVDANSNFFDITDEIWSDDFTMKYGWINIYIDNE